MKKVIWFFVALLLLAVVFILVNTLRFSSRQIHPEAISPIPVSDSVASHLSQAIQFKTISPENPADFDSTQFQELHDFLTKTYPLSDSILHKKTINNYSLLYKWQGTDNTLKPIILLGHLDVVPIADESSSNWKAAPFSGEIKDNIIWGRGAIDDKFSVIAILEATEMLLKRNYQPERTIYLAFGHDEEIGGKKGAQAIVKLLKSEKVSAEYVLDKGYAITQKLVPGIDKDVALIGIAEKGFLSLKLSVTIAGGHSSMPKPETAIDILAKGVSAVKQNPFPAKVAAPVREFISHIGPEMPFLQKAVFANAFLFEPVILNIYQKTPSGNALVTTTTAPTIFTSGIKENVIPQEATAIINFRTLPGTTIDAVIKHVKKVMNDDRIQVTLQPFQNEASPVSGTDTKGYQVLNKTIRQVFPETLTSPGLVLAATDSRFYYELSPNVYRFVPHFINKDNISAFHGTNERISISELKNAVRFYYQLIKNSNSQ